MFSDHSICNLKVSIGVLDAIPKDLSNNGKKQEEKKEQGGKSQNPGTNYSNQFSVC